MSDQPFHYQNPFPLGADTTEYELLTADHVSRGEFEGRPVLKVAPEGLTLLAAEAGAGFEAQRLGGKDENFATVRLAERFEHKFNQHARLWQSVEIMPQVDRFDNYVVNFEIGIETAITKSFSLKTYLVDTYANRPAVGRQKNDMKIVAAVAYKF